MKAVKRALLALAVTSAVLTLAGGAVVAGLITGRPAQHLVSRVVGINFGEVEPGLLRGGQPSTWRMAALDRTQQLRTVVSLAWADRPLDQPEADYFASRGVEYHRFSWRPNEVPSPAELDRALALLERAPRPIYVHCVGGKDRTGGLVGLWALRQGASLDDVTAQWERYGRPAPAWQRAVREAAAARAPVL